MDPKKLARAIMARAIAIQQAEKLELEAALTQALAESLDELNQAAIAKDVDLIFAQSDWYQRYYQDKHDD